MSSKHSEPQFLICKMEMIVLKSWGHLSKLNDRMYIPLGFHFSCISLDCCHLSDGRAKLEQQLQCVRNGGMGTEMGDNVLSTSSISYMKEEFAR